MTANRRFAIFTTQIAQLACLKTQCEAFDSDQSADGLRRRELGTVLGAISRQRDSSPKSY